MALKHRPALRWVRVKRRVVSWGLRRYNLFSTMRLIRGMSDGDWIDLPGPAAMWEGVDERIFHENTPIARIDADKPSVEQYEQAIRLLLRPAATGAYDPMASYVVLPWDHPASSFAYITNDERLASSDLATVKDRGMLGQWVSRNYDPVSFAMDASASKGSDKHKAQCKGKGKGKVL
ncbi:hypothetical protein GQ53DRAFT_748142 [Thozetella sp. PMI_491]|nr:hypothetical protein GQ53DRAFT_748142 [Thozetella sp. PMI_491]